MGVYLNLSNNTACNHANKKCNLDLSLGDLSVLPGVNSVLKLLSKEAFIPSGGSNTIL